MLHKTLGRILGGALLLYGSTALAFTLINLPEQLTPGTAITDTYTLDAQVTPIAGTIRSQIFGLRRGGSSQRTTQVGGTTLASTPYDPSGAAGGSGGGNSNNLWVSSTNDSLKNTFFRTEFYGSTQNVILGYDFTQSDKYVLGVSGGYEASNFVTKFNTGNERTRGYNLNPYFAWLLSDAWSLDLIGGYGWFTTEQERSVGLAAMVDSDFKSKRSFASTNLTNISAWGGLKLTSSLGYQSSTRNQNAYTEIGVSGNTVDASKQTSKQWNWLEELAFGSGNSETFFGARYEDIRNYRKIELTGGLGEQPANDPTSVLLSAGWRYFGKGLTASFMVSGRVAQEQVKGLGVAMVLRAEL